MKKEKRMKKEQRMMLQGGVTYEKESPERKVYIANLMYRYPEETETIELIPTETIVYNNSFGRTNEIVEQGRLRDIREEQEIRAREARLQRRNTSEKPARERIDYINKVGNVKDFGVPQVNENVIMKAKKQVKPEKNHEEIANLFYPSMTEKSQIQVKKKEPMLLGESSVLEKPDMITLADKEYAAKLNQDDGKKIVSFADIRKIAQSENDINFLNSLKIVFDNEGKYVNDKNDKGGPTNFGITQTTYDDYCRRHKKTYKNVKNLSLEDTITIYYNDYWKKLGLNNNINPIESLILFDTAVLHGVGRAKEFYKKANGNLYKLLDLRKEHYDVQVLKSPNQKKYYNGWLNRIHKLKDILDRYYIIQNNQ